MDSGAAGGAGVAADADCGTAAPGDGGRGAALTVAAGGAGVDAGSVSSTAAAGTGRRAGAGAAFGRTATGDVFARAPDRRLDAEASGSAAGLLAAITDMVTAGWRIADFFVLAAGLRRASAFATTLRVVVALAALLRVVDFAVPLRTAGAFGAVLRAVVAFLVLAAVPRAFVAVARRVVLAAPARVVVRLLAAVLVPVFALVVLAPAVLAPAVFARAFVAVFFVLAAVGFAVLPAFTARRGVVAFLGMVVSQVVDDEPRPQLQVLTCYRGSASAGQARGPPEIYALSSVQFSSVRSDPTTQAPFLRSPSRQARWDARPVSTSPRRSE